MIQTKLPSLKPSRETYCREITLVSAGTFYPKAFPQGKITVYPWDTTQDEWLLERMRSGDKHTVFFDLLPRISNLNGCPVDRFGLEEVLLVALVSRSILRSNKVNFTVTCPKCERKFAESVAVPDQLNKFGEKKADYPGYDDLTLPECGDVVRIRPLIVADALEIYRRDDAARTRISDNFAFLITSIVSVGGGTPDNVAEVAGYLAAIPPSDRAWLEHQRDVYSPQVSTLLDVTCAFENCKYAGIQHRLKLDEEFFRPVFGSVG